MVLQLLVDTDIHVEREEAVSLIADIGERIIARHAEQMEVWQLMVLILSVAVEWMRFVAVKGKVGGWSGRRCRRRARGCGSGKPR